MTQLVPNRLLCDLEFPLVYRKKMPTINGKLADWTDDELLPAFGLIDDDEPYAPLWACWNESGVAIATRVAGRKTLLKCDPTSFWTGDNLRLCTDMRDARKNKRATRFCQQFFFLPTGGGPDGKQPVAGSTLIHRAREDAPLFASASLMKTPAARKMVQQIKTLSPKASESSHQLTIAAHTTKTTYQLEAYIPAVCLSGFEQLDLNAEPRIGFYLILEDSDHGQQFLTVGDNMKWHIDPSTWPTAVLAQ